MGELILILGGARSGKSAEAVRMARERGSGKVLYVATAEPGDDEMRFRIEKHRAERPAGWHTLEAPYNVGQAIGTGDRLRRSTAGRICNHYCGLHHFIGVELDG